MATSYRSNPVFLFRQIDLAIEKLVVRPGSLQQRLVETRETLLISPSDLPTYTLAAEWSAIRAALAGLPAVTSDACEDAAVVIACSLLDFRNALRDWLLRNESLTDEDTAA